jgi:hypothetical protein
MCPREQIQPAGSKVVLTVIQVILTMNNSMDLSPSCEAASHAATEEFPNIFGSGK